MVAIATSFCLLFASDGRGVVRRQPVWLLCMGITIKKKTQVEKGRKSYVTAGIEQGQIKKMKQKGDATPGCDVNSLYIFLERLGRKRRSLKTLSLNTANFKWE